MTSKLLSVRSEALTGLHKALCDLVPDHLANFLYLPPDPTPFSYSIQLHRSSLPFLEKEMATHSSLAWKIPWTEEPVGLQSMGSQRVRHD